MKICDFLLVNPFCRFLRQFGWLESVTYFHINEQDGEQNAFMVNFSDNSDLRRGFKVSLGDFWDRDMAWHGMSPFRYQLAMKNIKLRL